jgi:hypothetical protein
MFPIGANDSDILRSSISALPAGRRPSVRNPISKTSFVETDTQESSRVQTPRFAAKMAPAKEAETTPRDGASREDTAVEVLAAAAAVTADLVNATEPTLRRRRDALLRDGCEKDADEQEDCGMMGPAGADQGQGTNANSPEEVREQSVRVLTSVTCTVDSEEKTAGHNPNFRMHSGHEIVPDSGIPELKSGSRKPDSDSGSRKPDSDSGIPGQRAGWLRESLQRDFAPKFRAKMETTDTICSANKTFRRSTLGGTGTFEGVGTHVLCEFRVCVHRLSVLL